MVRMPCVLMRVSTTVGNDPPYLRKLSLVRLGYSLKEVYIHSISGCFLLGGVRIIA